MITLSEEQIKLIEIHTLACFPEEMCGGLTKDSFIPFTNISSDKEHSFSVSSLELVQYIDSLIAIVHSHCRHVKHPVVFDTRTPSAADIKAQKKSNLPWLIVACEGITVTSPLEIPRQSNNEYIGRPFIWFVNDCYSLVQDYYKYELGIELPNHKANVDFLDLDRNGNLFDSFITEYNFKESSSLVNLRNGDLVLLDYNGKIRNHLGIYHNGNIIHQDLLSVEVPFETFIGRINKVLKYVSKSI